MKNILHHPSEELKVTQHVTRHFKTLAFEGNSCFLKLECVYMCPFKVKSLSISTPTHHGLSISAGQINYSSNKRLWCLNYREYINGPVLDALSVCGPMIFNEHSDIFIDILYNSEEFENHREVDQLQANGCFL